MVVSPRNVQRAEEYFRGMGVCIVAVSYYLRGFIVEPVLEKAYLDEKVKGVDEIGASV